MLADKLIAWRRDLSGPLVVAQRFVLSPLVVETLRALAAPAAIARCRRDLFTPAIATWIEWDGETRGFQPGSTKHGVLLVGAENDRGVAASIKRGFAMITDAWPDKHFRTRAADYDYGPANGPLLMPTTEMVTPSTEECSQIGAWIGAALALINTPRIADIRDHPVELINKRRASKGRPAILKWKDVHIRVDAGELAPAHLLSGTGNKPRHHVRAHFRVVRGRVAIIKPYWRGDARRGITLQRHLVVRAEDEGGPWQGGPLPPPRMLRPTDGFVENANG